MNSTEKYEQKKVIEQLKQQNELLKSQLMNTSLIHELTKVLHSCTNLEGIRKTVLLAIQEIIEFDRVIFFEIDRDHFALKPESWVGINESDLQTLSIPLGFEGGEITDSLFLNRHVLVEAPDTTDIFFATLNSSSYLVLPLVNKINRSCWETKSCTKTNCPAHRGHNPYCWSIMGSGLLTGATNEVERRKACITCPCFKVEGVLWMDRNSRSTPITSDDITTLTAIITMTGIVIENFRIYNELELANNNLQSAYNQLKVSNHDLQVAQARINSDLEHARSIQQGLLPQDLEDTTEFAIGARYLSADAVGGDYYDMFNIQPGIYGLVVADVSGHGIASALIMSMGKILLKTFSHNELSPQKTLEQINQTFLSEIKTDNFVTIFYAILDTNSKTLRYTSAGHCPVFFLDKTTATSRQIKADGLFLGVFPDMMLHETTISYTPGTMRLILYTDGLVEAKNSTDDMFGSDRLNTVSLQTLSLSPNKAMETILEEQTTFCGDISAPEDDITLLVIDF